MEGFAVLVTTRHCYTEPNNAKVLWANAKIVSRVRCAVKNLATSVAYIFSQKEALYGAFALHVKLDLALEAKK